MQCYCVASKKPVVRHDKTKPQTVMVIFFGLEVSMHVVIFILIHQYTIIINLSESNKEFAVFLTFILKLIPVHSTDVTVTLVPV